MTPEELMPFNGKYCEVRYERPGGMPGVIRDVVVINKAVTRGCGFLHEDLFGLNFEQVIEIRSLEANPWLSAPDKEGSYNVQSSSIDGVDELLVHVGDGQNGSRFALQSDAWPEPSEMSLEEFQSKVHWSKWQLISWPEAA